MSANNCLRHSIQNLRLAMNSLIPSSWQEEKNGLYIIPTNGIIDNNQMMTNDVFSEKWEVYSSEELEKQEKLFEFQKKWFLTLYGFNDENELKQYLSNAAFILDAGCGLGYKSAWFASLAPNSKVVGIDYSTALFHAHETYGKQFQNLSFAFGDISNTLLETNIVDVVICDQVIMHTERPLDTLQELSRIAGGSIGEVLCYWYRKKALPRELIDEHFRVHTKNLSHDDLWELSQGVTKLGKILHDLNITTTFPSIPQLGIQGGNMDLQRFIYWNFIKCFWNEGLGVETSIATNFDWYSPVNAKRFSEIEVKNDLEKSFLKQVYWHSEEACYSGRFQSIS